MEECGLGPNGALMFCIEYLLDNFEWFSELLNDFGDDYLVIDTAGQIELTSRDLMGRFVNLLRGEGYAVGGVFLLDSSFLTSPNKFFSGVLCAVSLMVSTGMPHVNVMSKMDLLGDEGESEEVARYLDCDSSLLDGDDTSRYAGLNRAIGRLIDEFSLCAFQPLNIEKEGSLEYVLSHMDLGVQYGEDTEVKEPKEEHVLDE